MPRWYVQSPGAAVTGPVDSAELQAAWNRQQIPAGTNVCVEGLSNWVPFHTVAELVGDTPQPHVSPPMGHGYPPPGYGPPAYPQGAPQPPPKKGVNVVTILLGVVGSLAALVILFVAFGAITASGRHEVLAAQQQQQSDEKSALRSAPGTYLTVTTFAEDSGLSAGIINSYRRLSSVTVFNRANFAVTNLRGDVQWFDDRGVASCGVGTFLLADSLAAGETKTFSTDDGTMKSSSRVQCKGTTANVVITGAAAVE